MKVYRLTAVSNDNMSLVVDVERLILGLKDPRLQLGAKMPELWEPPPLLLGKGRKGNDADFWSYDHDEAFAVSDRVAAALTGAVADSGGLRLVPLHAEVRNLARKPAGEISRTLLAVTRQIDAVDTRRTTYKPYGDRVLALELPGATAFDDALVPDSGLFRQPSGSASIILAGESSSRPERSFRSIVAAAGWTGLRFIEV